MGVVVSLKRSAGGLLLCSARPSGRAVLGADPSVALRFTAGPLRTVFDTLDEMEGIAGDWMRRRYLNYVLDEI